jgi:hypothetical protein
MTATREGFHLARAAATFGDARRRRCDTVRRIRRRDQVRLVRARAGDIRRRPGVLRHQPLDRGIACARKVTPVWDAARGGQADALALSLVAGDQNVWSRTIGPPKDPPNCWLRKSFFGSGSGSSAAILYISRSRPSPFDARKHERSVRVNLPPCHGGARGTDESPAGRPPHRPPLCLDTAQAGVYKQPQAPVSAAGCRPAVRSSTRSE